MTKETVEKFCFWWKCQLTFAQKLVRKFIINLYFLKKSNFDKIKKHDSSFFRNKIQYEIIPQCATFHARKMKLVNVLYT